MKNLENLDWNLILEKIESYSTSETSKIKLSQIIPLKNAELALQSFNEIEEAGLVIKTGVRPFMQSLDFFSQWNLRLKKKAVLKTLEIKDIRSFCLECVALSEAIKDFQSPWLVSIKAEMMNAEEPLSAIDQLMTPNGDIRPDASERLYRLIQEKDKLRREVELSLDRLVKDHQMENYLQDKYFTSREGRMVLPIRSGMQHFVPGVIHASSQTKQTVYIEPEKVIPMNNRLRQIEVEIEEEIEHLLEEISKYLVHLNPEFDKTRDILELMDFRLSQAQFSILVKAHGCEFSDNEFDLIDLKHPMLALGKKEVITNSVQLTEEKSILLLSGPNAGGKTVLLKSIGLAAQMARCGLPICAEMGSKIPFFKDVITSIGDSQSVDEELSTFAAHLKILEKASKLKGHDYLILIDEICGSTDPEEGASLARSFIEEYSRNEVFAVITSHLSPLKTGWKETDKLINGSLEYDKISGKPTYKFIPGVPGESLAIQMAKRVGIDSKIVQRAIDLLSPTTRARLDGLEEIENLKKEIGNLQTHLKKQTSEAQNLKQKYEKMISEFEKNKDNLLHKELNTARKKVDEAISTVKAQEALNKHRQLQEIKFNLPEIVKAQTPDNESKLETVDDFAKKYPPGSKVYIPSLSQDGLIQSAPNSKGEVLIMSNSMRLQLPWFELKPPGKPINPTSNLVRKSSQFTVALVDEDRTLDLRGKTVEEAIEELELVVDRAFQNQEDRIKIIHGHGTEALKKGIRSYLSRSVLVRKWKAGTPENGGDGITWLELSKGD
jgi:DNA mismatch repair protein MutS2